MKIETAGGKPKSADMGSGCRICPRKCGANRETGVGFCGGGKRIRVARAALHHWEEPCVSGVRGSGTVFFSGCPLKCCFCQNHQISAQNFGREISVERLAKIFVELQDQGAHNINLVNPTHYAPWIAAALRDAKPLLHIPIICNSGGYESDDTLGLFDGLIDAYLPDFKYMDAARAERYSGAGDYPKIAAAAILEMYRQVGDLRFSPDGMVQKGVIVRHLALPKGGRDSEAILDWIAQNFSGNKVYLSLMSQFTPSHRCYEFPEINRRISSFEYGRLVKYAASLGLNGYMQERSAAKEEYTPKFDLSGL